MLWPWLVSQKPPQSPQGYKMVAELGCCLLPLLQPKAQRVCSSSKLKCLELKTIRDTFSPCGYQHSVPLSPLSWQGRRQQWQARETGRGMGALVGGGMCPAAWQELDGSGRMRCHLLPLQSPSAQPQSQGIQRRPYLQLNFFYPRRQEASLSNSLQEWILMEEIREKLKAWVVCFKHWMFPWLGYFGLWLSSLSCYT